MIPKKVFDGAQKIADLKILTNEILPATLRQQILLPNIEKIRLHYRPNAKNVGLSVGFLRRYGAAIRYHNPHIEVQRLREASGPPNFKFEVYKKGVPTPILIKADKKEKVKEIVEAIQEIDEGKNEESDELD